MRIYQKSSTKSQELIYASRMKRRFYRDRRERRRRWAEKVDLGIQKSEVLTESDRQRFRDNPHEFMKYIKKMYLRRGIRLSEFEPNQLHEVPLSPSTIPPIPPEPRRREFRDEPVVVVTPFFSPDPKYKKLWRAFLRFLRIHVQYFRK